MLGHARGNGILLMQRREIDRVGLVKQQCRQQLFLCRSKTRQIQMTHQVRGMNRRLFEIDTQANLMQRTGAQE
ncbi:hypothetical protein D3C81_2071690 [compost metagenome]